VVKRLVRRATIKVNVQLPNGDSLQFEALAGSNLRMLLLQRDIKLYDSRTRRFDQPYARGDCGGEGLCGTCLAAITKGAELLSAPDSDEQLLLRKRPASWRAACRVVVGAKNDPGEICVRLSPQSQFEDEL
jgi:ferredoxin